MNQLSMNLSQMWLKGFFVIAAALQTPLLRYSQNAFLGVPPPLDGTHIGVQC